MTTKRLFFGLEDAGRSLGDASDQDAPVLAILFSRHRPEKSMIRRGTRTVIRWYLLTFMSDRSPVDDSYFPVKK